MIIETVEYHFEDDLFIAKAEKFSTQATWDNISEVTLTKKCLLIDVTKSQIFFIPIRYVNNEVIVELKYISTRHGIKNNL